MIGRTEERLRDTTAALGRVINPQDIHELRLPEVGAQRSLEWPSLGRRPRWVGRGLTPLAAAAAMLALVGSLAVAGKVLGEHGRGAAPAASAPAASSPPASQRATVPPGTVAGLPQYLVTDVQGHGYIRSSATGELVGLIRPAARYFSIEGIAVAPDDRTFYLAGTVPAPSGSGQQIEFFRVVLSAEGLPGPAQRLPGPPVPVPDPITSSGWRSIPLAISPDGGELAYATGDQIYGPGYDAAHPAAVVVQNVATGASRSWTIWPAEGTTISSLSWGAGGQLGYAAVLASAAVSHGAVVQAPRHGLSAFLVLNTTASGSSLPGDSRLAVSYSTPVGADGSMAPPAVHGGVLSPDGGSAYVSVASRSAASGGSDLVRISLATGKVTKVLLRGALGVRAEPSSIDANYLLVSLYPRSPVHRSSMYVCGHLAGIELTSARIRLLPVPLYCSTIAPPPVLQASW